MALCIKKTGICLFLSKWWSRSESGSLTVIKSKNIGKPLKYGFFFVKFLFLYVVCVVIMI